MDVSRRVLGVEHPITLKSMNNLSITYQNQGRLNEAEKFQADVMDVRRCLHLVM
jgi:Tetratricopeptide repeat